MGEMTTRSLPTQALELCVTSYSNIATYLHHCFVNPRGGQKIPAVRASVDSEAEVSYVCKVARSCDLSQLQFLQEVHFQIEVWIFARV